MEPEPEPEPGTRTQNTEPKTQNRSDRLLRLHAILDVEASAAAQWDVLDLATAFLDGGARLIQLRAKQLSSGRLLELADRLVVAAEPFKADIVINDRADIALMAGASGVHVGQDDLPPAAARRLLGIDAIVGYSTHTVEQVAAAAAEPVTYVAIGPVFGTRTKDTGYEAIGLAMVTRAVELSRARPVVAIGGITLDRVPALMDAGAAGVAVISDLLVGNPRDRVAAYRKTLGL